MIPCLPLQYPITWNSFQPISCSVKKDRLRPTMTTRIDFGWLSIAIMEGWNSEVGADDEVPFLAIVPTNAQAELRLTPCDFSVVDYSAREWIEIVARMNRMKGRRVSETSFNGFSGYECEFATDDLRIHGRCLEHSGSPLDITYRCPVDLDISYDQEAISMLQSLRRLTNAESGRRE
jgi:hypothetical protein